jgi:protease II
MAEEIKQDALSIIDEAKKVRDEIKAENDRREQILANEQKLQAEKMLGSSAGQPAQIVPAPVETPKQYAERIMQNKP